MPSPFNNTDEDGVDENPDGIVQVVNSILTCMYCFHESENGTYYTKSETLVWSCEGCGDQNVVRDIKL